MRQRIEAEDGATLIEVLAAIAILAVGVLGLIGGFNSSRKLTLTSERRTTMAHVAQRELERLQTLGYKELAMSSAPSHSSETGNPDYYVNASPTKCTSEGYGCYAWNAENHESEETIVGGSEGKISPTSAGKCTEHIGTCEWSDGALSGYVYDFVTWHTDTACTACTVKDKRLTVVATVKVPSGTKEVPPVHVSTLIAQP